MTFRSVVRLGSTTDLPDTVTNGGRRVELNTINSVRTSSNKLLMKRAFEEGGVKTALWWVYENGRGFINQGNNAVQSVEELPYPIVAKHIYGSRGRGNVKIDDVAAMNRYLAGRTNFNNYIFEVYHSFSREYRLHVTRNGCFYTCRKMIKSDTPDNQKWFRNDSNCVWILEENNSFDKPVNWDEIVQHSVRALTSVGLDIGATDVKVQSSTVKGRRRERCDFFIIEINSAPSFGDITLDKYKEVIPELLTQKKQLV